MAGAGASAPTINVEPVEDDRATVEHEVDVEPILRHPLSPVYQSTARPESQSSPNSRCTSTSSGYFSDSSRNSLDENSDPQMSPERPLEHSASSPSLTVSRDHAFEISPPTSSRPQSRVSSYVAPALHNIDEHPYVGDVGSDSDEGEHQDFSADESSEPPLSGRPCSADGPSPDLAEPSPDLADCHLSRSSSVESPCHVVAIQEEVPDHQRDSVVARDQADVEKRAGDCPVWTGEMITRWLSTQSNDESHDNLDVANPVVDDGQYPDSLPPTHFQVTLTCPNDSEVDGRLISDVKDHIGDLRQSVAHIGDLESVDKGSIVLTFRIENEEEKRTLLKAVDDGTLLKTVEKWLKRTLKFEIKGKLTLTICEPETLEEPVGFTFCHCRKQWYWSIDHTKPCKWHSVKTHDVVYNGKLRRPIDSDIAVMKQLADCKMAPHGYAEKSCLVCPKGDEDSTKALEQETANVLITMNQSKLSNGEGLKHSGSFTQPDSGFSSQRSSGSYSSNLDKGEALHPAFAENENA